MYPWEEAVIVRNEHNITSELVLVGKIKVVCNIEKDGEVLLMVVMYMELGVGGWIISLACVDLSIRPSKSSR